jgi:predicted TIM-barrel fold metal-dependent hydrolase
MSEPRPPSTTARHIVISADGHAFGPGNGLMDTSHLAVLTDYFEARYRSAYLDEVERLEREVHERMARVLGALFDPRASRSVSEQADATSPGTRGLFDSQHRLEELERDGIVAEVLFPNGAPFAPGFGGPVSPPELRAAGARAYNRWLIDFCDAAPGRRAGMGIVTLHDIDQAARDVHVAKAAGLAGVLLPSYWATEGLPPYLDPCYEPFWSACADAGMPLNVHGGASIGDVDMRRYGMPALLTFATETTFLSTRALTQLVWGGVFERHPDLVLVLTESRADWVPSRLAFLDAVYRDQLFAHVKDTVKHKPSEYWHRQCYVVASFMSRDEALLRHTIGLDRLLWGADYPHFEGTWPHTDRWLKETFGGLPAHEVSTILAENPARVFGFDLDQLRLLAASVGPRVAEIRAHEPSGTLWRW